jgi:hypothetical protein
MAYQHRRDSTINAKPRAGLLGQAVTRKHAAQVALHIEDFADQLQSTQGMALA